MKNRTTDGRIFFSDLVDFAIYVVHSGGATIFLSRFSSGPAKHAEFTAGPFDRRIKKGLVKPYYKSRL
jgi:hypothetical protein